MKVADDKRLITKVCLMHYKQNLSQKDVAEATGLSRPTVSRLIKRGHDLGIVEVKVNTDLGDRKAEMEVLLETRLNLRKVIIVESEALRDIAYEACRDLRESIEDGDYIGIGTGEFLELLPEFAEGQKLDRCVFIPMIASTNSKEGRPTSSEIASGFAAALGGTAKTLAIPAYWPDEKVKGYMLNEPGTQEILQDYSKMKAAIFEIDTIEGNRNNPEVDSERLRELKAQGAVGETLLRFYDERGKTAGFTQNALVIGMDPSELVELECSIALAAGAEKALGVIGAARGGFMNTLIIDKSCAEEILLRI